MNMMTTSLSALAVAIAAPALASAQVVQVGGDAGVALGGQQVGAGVDVTAKADTTPVTDVLAPTPVTPQEVVETEQDKAEDAYEETQEAKGEEPQAEDVRLVGEQGPPVPGDTDANANANANAHAGMDHGAMNHGNADADADAGVAIDLDTIEFGDEIVNKAGKTMATVQGIALDASDNPVGLSVVLENGTAVTLPFAAVTNNNGMLVMVGED